MTSGMWLADEDGEDLVDLSNIEPWSYNVEGKPVTRITYGHNFVTIEWATQEDLDRIKNYFDE